MGKDYNNLNDSPYNKLLHRESELSYQFGVQTPVGNQQGQGSGVTGSGNDDGTTQGKGGSVATVTLKSEGNATDVWIQNFIRSTSWKPKTVGFYINGRTGYAEFANVYVSGTIVVAAGSVGGFDIGPDYIRDHLNTMGMASTVTGGNDVRFWAGESFANRDTAPFRVYEDGVVFVEDINVAGGEIDQAALKITNRGWSSDIIFEVGGEDQVNWSAGTLTSADGTSYPINSGNTGSIGNLVYIYFIQDFMDLVVSGTYSDAVGEDRILIAVAENNFGGARYQVFGGAGGVDVTSLTNRQWSAFGFDFTSSGEDVVAWSGGTIVSANGQVFTISAGNTPSLSEFTNYLYFDAGVDTSNLQFTDDVELSVGPNKILLGTVTSNKSGAHFHMFSGGGWTDLSNLSTRQWSTDIVFTPSSSDSQTLDYSSGTMQSANSFSYSIIGDSISIPASGAYIYFDPNLSTTSLSFSAISGGINASVGKDRILVGVAYRGNGYKCSFQIFSGSGGIRRPDEPITGASFPSETPDAVGQHFIRDNGDVYIAIGTSSDADWVLLTNSGPLPREMFPSQNVTVTESVSLVRV